MSLSGSYKRLFLITASVALIAITGCGGDKKSQEAAQQQGVAGQQAPEGHSGMSKTEEDISKVQHANIKTQKTVSLTDAVKAKWKEAELQVTDASSGASQLVKVKVGGDIMLKEGVRLKLEALVPDYAIADSRIESRSNEANNPAVLIELTQGDKSVAKGWVFRDYPEFNSYTESSFPVKLVLGAPAASAAK